MHDDDPVENGEETSPLLKLAFNILKEAVQTGAQVVFSQLPGCNHINYDVDDRLAFQYQTTIGKDLCTVLTAMAEDSDDHNSIEVTHHGNSYTIKLTHPEVGSKELLILQAFPN